MATWFIRTTGSDLNSGSTDANAAAQSGSLGVLVGTTLTEAGAFAGAAASGAVNLQDGGVSTIRTYTKTSDDAIEIDSAPAGGNGTYAWKIGGARALLSKVVATGAGQNAKFAANDTVGCKGGTYTDNTITAAAACRIYSSDEVEAVFDGTGGGAGSDVFPNGQNINFYKIAAINAVDNGFVRTGNAAFFIACRAQGNAATGWTNPNGPLNFCKAVSNGTIGVLTGTVALTARFCHFDGNTSHGVSSTTGTISLMSSIFSDNGGDGWNQNGTMLATLPGAILSCTFDGNTGDGVEFTTALGLPIGSIFRNNLITNNANGVNSVAAVQTNYFDCDYNLYFGNSTPRVNFTTGTNDKSTDPQYTAAASDDYTIKAAGGAYRAGYDNYQAPTLNLLHIGAVPGPGSAESVGGGGGGGGRRRMLGFGL